MTEGRLESSMRMGLQLLETRRFFAHMWGEEEFKRRAEPWKASLRESMKQHNETNILKHIIPIAKRMGAAGEDPSFLLAVASDMCGEDGQ